MQYSVVNHKERKRNRLQNYDYSHGGYYFVTTSTKHHEEFFGNIENNTMILNEYGEIVQKQWLWLADQYEYIKLDEYIVMPNHCHGIVAIDSVGTGRDLSLQGKIKSLSELIGAFKTTS